MEEQVSIVEVIPMEVIAYMVDLCLRNPVDCLNLALTCKDMYAMLIGGPQDVNRIHTFKHVPFEFFVEKKMWDMLRLRKLTSEYAQLLVNSTCPNTMFIRAANSMKFVFPKLFVIISYAGHNNSEKVVTTIGQYSLDSLLDRECFRSLFMTVVRFRAGDVLHTLIDHFTLIPGTPFSCMRKSIGDCLWEAVYDLDSVWAFRILQAREIVSPYSYDVDYTGPRIAAEGVSTGDPLYVFSAVFHGVTPPQEFDMDHQEFYCFYQRCCRQHRFDIAEAVVRCNISSFGALCGKVRWYGPKTDGSQCSYSFQLPYPYVSLSHTAQKKHVEKVFERFPNEFKVSDLKEIAKQTKNYHAAVVCTHLPDPEWREVLVHACKESVTRFRLLWGPQFSGDYELFKLSDARPKRIKANCLGFVRLFGTSVLEHAVEQGISYRRSACKKVLQERAAEAERAQVLETFLYLSWRERRDILVRFAREDLTFTQKIWSPEFEKNMDIFEAGMCNENATEDQSLRFIRNFHNNVLKWASESEMTQNFLRAFKQVEQEREDEAGAEQAANRHPVMVFSRPRISDEVTTIM